MKKALIYTVLIFLNITLSNAQKYEISYGPVLGLNMSFLNSKASIDHENYPFSELDRDFNLSSTNETGIGYNLGFFINIKHLNYRINILTGLQIATFNNSHTISLDYTSYSYTPPTERWMPASEFETIHNDLSILNIPVEIGYDILKKEKYNLTFLLGISPNYIMKSDNTKIDINFEENDLYNDFFLSYQAGIKADFNKVFCILRYERSFNIQQVSSRDYFPWQINVEKLYLNSLSLSVGYRFN